MSFDFEKVKKFMSQSIVAQRRCFMSETITKSPNEFRIPENDEEVLYLDEEWKITESGAEYLLDTFSSDWDRENLSYDQWYFMGYKCAMNDLLHFLNRKMK